MLTHDSQFETLATAPVKTTDVEVARQIVDPYGNYDDFLWTSDDVLMSVKLDAVGSFSGTATKKASVRLIGIVDTATVGDLFQIRLGLWDSAAFNYVSQGFFIVDKIEFNYDDGYTTVTLYDHMWTAKELLYNEDNQSDGLSFPTTVAEMASFMASAIDAELMSGFGELPNAYYEVAVDPYANISNATIQNIIQEIAGATGTIARMTDTTLTFVPFEVDSENLDSNTLRKLSIGDPYGPVNSVIFGRVPQNDNIVISSPSPETTTVDAVDDSADLITVDTHGMEDGTLIRITSDGTLPAPLEENTNYYVYTGGNPNDFSLATSYDHAKNAQHSLTFDGADDYVDAGSNITGLGDQLTVHWKGSITSRGNQQQLIGNRTDTASNGFYLHKDFSSSKIRFGLGDGTNYQSFRTTTAADAFPSSLEGEVVDITATYNAGAIAIYVNGVLFDSELYAGTAFSGVITDGAQTLRAGRYQTSSAYDLDGTMEQVKIWSTALDAEEVKGIVAGNTPQRSALELEWLFTDGTGATVTDTSDSSNNGTITGATWTDNRQLIDITSEGTGNISLVPLETQEVQVNNNEIVDDDRTILLPPVYEALVGIGWNEVEADTVGLGWHEVGDVINFTQGSTTVQAFISEIHLNLDGSIKENIRAEVPDVEQINYQAAGGILKTVYNTEIKVDKQENEIVSIVEQQDIYEDTTNTNFTQVYQDIDNISLTVQKSGGGNLITNSVGYAKDARDDDSSVSYDHLTFWDYNASYDTAGDGVALSYSSSESQNNGGVSGQVIEMSGADMYMEQRVEVASGQPLSFGIRVDNSIGTGTATITISNDNETFTINVDSGTAYDWTELTLEDFQTTLPWVDVKIEIASATSFVFTDLRLLYGTTLTGWVQSSSEILSANVQFTELGMKIFDNVHDTETQVTYNEFSTRRRSDGAILFEADDEGIVANKITQKSYKSYFADDAEVIRQITIPNSSSLAGIAFIKVS